MEIEEAITLLNKIKDKRVRKEISSAFFLIILDMNDIRNKYDHYCKESGEILKDRINITERRFDTRLKDVTNEITGCLGALNNKKYVKKNSDAAHYCYGKKQGLEKALKIIKKYLGEE